MSKKKSDFNTYITEMKVYEEIENNEVPHRAAVPTCRTLLVTKKILRLSTVLEIAVLPAAHGSPRTEAPAHSLRSLHACWSATFLSCKPHRV